MSGEDGAEDKGEREKAHAKEENMECGRIEWLDAFQSLEYQIS